jgi:hypothetical protein
MFKTAKMSLEFSKIFKRLSTTTWFVCGRDPLLDVDQDHRWSNKWRSSVKDVSLWWVPPSFRGWVNRINFLDRIQVRSFSALDDKCLTSIFDN